MPRELFSRKIIEIRKLLRHEIEQKIEIFDLTVAQFSVLRRLWDHDNQGTLQLAKETGLDTGTITGVLDRLEHKGLIRRERSALDRRSVNVSLTSAAAELEDPLSGILAEVNEKALSSVAPEDQLELHRILDQILGNLREDREPANWGAAAQQDVRN